MDNTIALLIVIILALIFDVLTGMLSAPTIVATIIASRAVGPRKALLLSTFSQFIGPFLLGAAVASTTSVEVLDIKQLSMLIIFAALLGAIIWTLFSWWVHIPSSTSHAQVGALFGAALAALGPDVLRVGGLIKIIVGLVIIAPFGLLGGFVVVRACYALARGATPKINRRFNQGQVLTSFILGVAIGSNSAQRTVGVIMLGLLLTGYVPNFTVPMWVILISAAGLCLGTLVGGARLMRSIGAGFFKVRPIHGFSAQVASAAIIVGSSVIGAPVSTTSVTSLAVIGAGAAERVSGVRWLFVRDVVMAWVLTTPISALLGAVFYSVLKLVTVNTG